MSWPKDDEIRWVAQRVRERECIEQEETAGVPKARRQHPDWRKYGEFSNLDYLAWLLHERDRLPFEAVGKKLYSEADDGDSLEAGDRSAGEPARLKMRACRAWQRVEWEFGRGPLKRKQKSLGSAISGVVLPAVFPAWMT